MLLEELLPEDVWREPQPVLSVQGDVDWDPGIHDRLIQALHAVGLDLASVGGGPLGSTTMGINANSVPFRFLSLDKAVVFPPKKPPSPLKAPDGRPLDGYAIKGLLKGSWLHKHVAQLPSVAILVAPLDMAWSVPEWSRREQQLLQDLDRLRAQLGPRDVRVFTLLVRHRNRAAASSASSGGAPPLAQEEREVEERLMALRRRLPPQYDNKLLYVLSDPADLSPASPAMRRVYKHVRDASSGYYFLAAKRVKRLETALSRHTQAPLIVRYRLKTAFWTEFLGDVDKAAKYYRKAFDALLDMNAMLLQAAGAAPGAAPSPAVSGGGGGTTGRGGLGVGPFTPGGGGGGGGVGCAPVPLGLGLSGSGALAAGAAGAAGAYQLSTAHTLGGWLSQVKAVAEIVNFKLCYYGMREARHPDAVAQFRQLLQTWCWRAVRSPRITTMTSRSSLPPPPPTPTDSGSSGSLALATPRGMGTDAAGIALAPQRRLDFLHYEWVSRQYQLFAGLLQRFPAPPPPPTPSTTNTGLSAWQEAEAYVGPDHHLFTAALYLAKERGVARFLADNPRADSKFAARVATNLGQEGPLLSPPLYVGGRPRLVDPSLEEGRLEADLNELIQLILERDEAQKPLADGVRRLLAAAVAAYDPFRAPRQRFKGLQHLQLADELLAAEMPAEAWPHYCAALRRYSEEAEAGSGWHLLSAGVLLRTRRAAAALGKQGHYLDCTLRLLSHGLRAALGAEDRRLLCLEALYLLYGLPEFASAAAAATSSGGEALPSVFTARFPPAASAGTGEGGAVTYDEGEEEGGAGGSMMDEGEGGTGGASQMGVPPMLQLLPEGIEAALDCGGGRQLLSFSVAFPQATAAMGGACPLILRVVSHLPLPLRPSRLLLRFNKDYLGTITVLDASSPASSSPTERLKAALLAPPPPSAAAAAPPPYQDVDDNGAAQAPLLLLPDTPLDLRLAVPVPTHELVEVGDLLHALRLQVVVGPPSPAITAALPCGARPCARPLTLSVPSGVTCLEGTVLTANVCCYTDDAAVVSQPSSLPVPLHASLRGFPAVEVIRPLASATLGLAGVVASTAAGQGAAAEDEGPGRALPSVPTLVGHMHCLWVRIESNTDRLGTPMLYVRSDPPPPTASAEDALFFRLGPGEQAHAPLKLGKDGQPEKALDVLELAGAQGQGKAGSGGGGGGADNMVPPQSSLLVPVWVRAAQEGRVKVNMVLVYHSASIPPSAATGLSPPRRMLPLTQQAGGAAAAADDDDEDAFSNLMVSSEFVFDLEAYPPFATAFDVASPCPAPLAQPQQQAQDIISGVPSAQHALFTGEEVIMRFGVKSLSPPPPLPPPAATAGESGNSSPPAQRPLIESIVWHPEEGAPIAGSSEGTSGTSNGGRVLYSRAAEEKAAAVREQQQQQQQQQQPPPPSSSPLGSKRRPRPPAAGTQQQQQQLQDVLSLSFHFRCPPKPSSHPLPLGHMRIHWTAPQPPPPAAAAGAAGATAGAITGGWASYTDVPCPSVSVVQPDVAVHLQAPLEVRAGQPFRLRWTLENLLPDRLLDLRVLVAEGGGGPAGVSSEEALIFGGIRESVVQLLPRRSLALAYRVVALVTGPVALPRLVLTPLSPPPAQADAGDSGAPQQQQHPLLRVSYRYVDNVMSAAGAAAAAVPPTPSSTGGPDQQQPQAAPAPADTRHLFVLPPVAADGGGGGASQ